MALSDHLETLARSYWESWRTLRLSQGWTLGADNGSAKMSPYLVHSFDGLDATGKQWFRQEVALVLHAIDALGAETPAPSAENETIQKALTKLTAGLKAIDEGDFMLAERKVRTGVKLLKGEPIRSKKS